MKLLEFDIVFRWVDSSNREDCRESFARGPFIRVKVTRNELLVQRTGRSTYVYDVLARCHHLSRGTIWFIDCPTEPSNQGFSEWELVPHSPEEPAIKPVKRRTVVLEGE
jgi:hypothetical protein